MTNKKKNRAISACAGFLALVCAASKAAAHDFWIQPDQFWIKPDTSVLTSLQVGHGQFRQRWTADSSRVTAFYSLSDKGKIDRQAELRAGSMEQDHKLRFIGGGAQILVLQTSSANSELPAIRFNAYLKDEGMTPALEFRARNKTAEMPGREMYSRRAKALVQVGPANSNSDKLITSPVGLSLEIVPDINPYTAPSEKDISVLVLFEGRPLAGCLVMLNNLDFDGRPLEQSRTDASGRAVFKVPRTGNWQLNVVWTKPIEQNADADFETTFSSLTFGFPHASAFQTKAR